MTELKRIERALQENNVELEGAKVAAEEANLAKSEFLSSMSHELRSPLNAILGFAQLMESDPKPPTAAQRGSIDQILKAGWHLLRLIDEILDLTKVESGQVPLSLEPVSLADVMRECQGMVESQAKQYGIEMTFPVFENPFFVRADRTRVIQVIVNLLSNAIKYNTPKGAVQVECTEGGGRTRVRVTDTGRGLDDTQLSHLFQAFNRLGQEAGSVEGTGIGLVVARQLVELMGGEIAVESTVGVGSVFSFDLASVSDPMLALKADDTEPSDYQRAPQGPGPHTLLCVEDNPANLRLVEQMIGRYPEIRLLTAVNGTSGVEMARVFLPDVVLMDIHLPDISGFEALQILQSDPATNRIPVVAVSANAMSGDIKRGLEAGFFRYITKPIKIDEFMLALDEALESIATDSPRT
jgi:CheY-like chemotaxis protein